MLTLFDASILRLITIDLIPPLCTEFTAVELFSLHIAMAPKSNASTLVGVISRGIQNAYIILVI